MASPETTLRSTSGAVLWRGDAGSVREAVEAAVRDGANLTGANLTGAYLAHANLAHANLAHANLARANLTGANLTGANLTGAYLAHANLAHANLAHANLARADLTGANLADANLAGANLARANLARAYLARANLAHANLAHANLADASLAGATGIDYCVGGWVLRYGWTLLRRPDERPTLRYGCVEAPLGEWTDERIDRECLRHESSDSRYPRALRALVAYCREVDAVHSVEVDHAD